MTAISNREGRRAQTPKPAGPPTMLDAMEAIASQKRIEVLALLLNGPRGVTDLAESLKYEVSDISRVLKTMRENEILEAQVRHRDRLQRLAPGLKLKLKDNRLIISLTTARGERARIETILDPATLRTMGVSHEKQEDASTKAPEDPNEGLDSSDAGPNQRDRAGESESEASREMDRAPTEDLPEDDEK